MAPSKRKYDEIEDSDSDEPSFGKQILPVANLPYDFDGEPMDGMQYLFTVRRDAKALPQFTRVVNPYESTQKHCVPTIRPDPHPTIPSKEWRECSEERWRSFHKNFNQPTIGISAPAPPQKLLPDKSERDAWWEFLAGRPESVWGQSQQSKKKNKGKKQQQADDFVRGILRAWGGQDISNLDENEEENGRNSHDMEKEEQELVLVQAGSSNLVTSEGEIGDTLTIEPRDSLPTPTGTPDHLESLSSKPSARGATEEDQLVPREPTPHLLKLIDERMALHLLMYFTFWIHRYLRQPGSSTYHLTDTHARWMFSLLLRIDYYISADDLNLLRNLARACSAFIKAAILEREKGDIEMLVVPELKIRSMGERACWIIISGIVGIWGQKDLWATVEDTLSELK